MLDDRTTSVGTLEPLLEASRKGFSIREIDLVKSGPHWAIRDGFLQHSSGGFFSVVGVAGVDGAHGKLMLYQPQGAVNGLLISRSGRKDRYLLQARAEPGNIGEVQFGPSLQSTPANFLKFHGGKTSDYFPHFLEQGLPVALIKETTQLDLGGLYVGKTKRVIIQETREDFEPNPSFYWLEGDAIRDEILQSFTFNTDMRALLAVADWSPEPDRSGLTPVSREIRSSLAAPRRSDVLGSVIADLSSPRVRDLGFLPLTQMKNWQIAEDGIREIEPSQGIQVKFHQVEAINREVSRWVQPLIAAHCDGTCILVCRERAGFVEFLVRPVSEIGLAGGRALGPSWLSYPGVQVQPPRWLERSLDDVWAETMESDEGGRFYRHASRFAVVRQSGEEASKAPDGTWLRLSELKALLSMSSVCTIQLRVIVSLLLGLR